ncbi:MAG: PadR family transcriptional regulator [Acidobacteria bacterium]|nr:PadR family transcriptional regulator [Acidobacteriota bacterium]
MALGDLQNLTILAVAQLGEDAVARGVREFLATETGREVAVPTIFVTLTRLEDQGLLKSVEGDAPERGGRRRRVFAVTQKGWGAVKSARAASEKLWAGLDR